MKKEIEELESKLARAVKALKEISEHKGQTLLGECCVDKNCVHYFEDNKDMGCSHRYGVNRGFEKCASIASEILKEIKGEK